MVKSGIHYPNRRADFANGYNFRFYGQILPVYAADRLGFGTCANAPVNVSLLECMNLRIESHADNVNGRGFQTWIQPLLVCRLGWIVVAFLIILAITDSYYLKALHPGENVTYLGGPASIVGVLLACLSLNLASFHLWRRKKPPLIMAPRIFYLTLTDEYAERGIIGWNYVRYHWCMLSDFKENSSQFIVRMSLAEFTIAKAGVKDEKQIGEIRELLKSKLPKLVGA